MDVPHFGNPIHPLRKIPINNKFNPSNDAANRDLITGEPGAHPLGTGVGAAIGGAATGAAVVTLAGPVGMAIGAAAGAIVGGLAGKAAAESVTQPSKRHIGVKTMRRACTWKKMRNSKTMARHIRTVFNPPLSLKDGILMMLNQISGVHGTLDAAPQP